MDDKKFRYRRSQIRRPRTTDGFLRVKNRAIDQQYNTGTRRLEDYHRPFTASASKSYKTAADYTGRRARSKLVRIRLDMSLPGAREKARKLPALNARSFRPLRTWLLRTAVALLVLSIGAGSLLAAGGYWKLHKVFNGNSSSAVALQKDVDPSLLKGEGDGRINILLLGNGGGTHEAPDLTDTIILASIDPVNNKADLVSVPRDLWVNVAGYGDMKINAAYETGKYAYLHKIDNSNANHAAVAAGIAVADRSVEQVLGVNIDYNVLVNFQAFSQAVDTVGGVSINVPQELYDPTMAWENHWNPVLAKPGQQTFNGSQALLYVRSRETTSDFARSERQRAVLVALKDKVLTLGTLSNPLKIANLIGAFGDNVQTDLSLGDTSRLVSIVKKIDNTNIKSIGLTDAPNNYVTTGDIGNQSVVLPTAGLFKYGDIQKYIRGVLVDGYIAKENARIVVLNGTATAGLSAEKANELKSYGYNVVSVSNAPTPDYKNTVIVDLTHGRDKYTAHYLQQRFGVTPVSTISDKSIQTGHADFIIVLGNDETFSSQD